MTRSLMISLLRKGNTGNEILNILDTLASDTNVTQPATNEPTLKELEF